MRGRVLRSVFVMLVCGTIGLGAQTSEVTTKTKTTVKDGTKITTTGCVSRMDDGRFMLRNADGGAEYILVGKNVAHYMNRRVEVRGKATDIGDAKVRTETTMKTDVEHGKDEKARVKVDETGKLSGTPLLGVKSVRTLAKSCS